MSQSIQDFEIVVVDDSSSDRSCDVISSFNDPRIKLMVNSTNIGGAASYNRAVQAARGEFLVNLDADDWIAPRKCEAQVMFLRRNRAEVVGTYVNFVDGAGEPHPQAAELAASVNRPLDLNSIDGWIGQNNLVRSSTMVDRSAHLRVGLDDPDMARACDYELWTRFLRLGCRFAVLPERLTYYRLHSRGVTHVDPRATLLEMSFTMLRNLVPLIDSRATYASLARMLDWVTTHERFATLRPRERYYLLGAMMTGAEFSGFGHFCQQLSSVSSDPSLVAAGRRLLALLNLRAGESEAIAASSGLLEYLDAVTEARDFWHQQSEAWETEAKALQRLLQSGVLGYAARVSSIPSRVLRRLLSSTRPMSP